MRYASVCSGVEAASLAWEPLGWKPVWFSEIEPFPSAVLKVRFQNVPNLGDMTKIEGEKYHGTVDLLVGGTPCQDVSVAGKRKGFAGERSGLAFSYIRLLETMRPSWFVWENVPGVLSSNDGEDFKAFIRSADEVGYSCAWRVLDAQYVRVDGFPRAIPQRRRRVFVVGHLGTDWRYPASVLFEPESLFRNTPPRRRTGAGVARSVTASTGGASEKEQQLDFVGGDGQPLNVIESGSGFYSESKTAQTLKAQEDQHRRNIVCRATGQGGAETSEDCAVNLTCNHEAPLICAGFCQGASPTAGGIGYHEQVSPTIKAGESGTAQVPAVICVHGSQNPIVNSDHANAIGRNQGAENCVCIQQNTRNEVRLMNGNGQIAGALAAETGAKQQNYVFYNPQDSQTSRIYGTNGSYPSLNANSGGGQDRSGVLCYENHMQDSRIKECGGCSPQINAKAGTGGGNLPLVQAISIAENIIGRKAKTGGNGVGAKEDVAYTQNCTGVMGVSQNETVRRLTPIECERLMGFPDNWTRIPWKLYQECVRKGWSFESELEKRGKKLKTTVDDCPDSPRYKACGNSMCVNVMRWIGMRIELVERKGVSC